MLLSTYPLLGCRELLGLLFLLLVCHDRDFELENCSCSSNLRANAEMEMLIRW